MGSTPRFATRCAFAALIVIASSSYAGVAAAQSAERGVAQSLFEEGVRLLRAKQYAEACPKLAESHRLEPATGTILNLAVCLEQDGKLASAYVAYGEALARAKREGNKQRTQVAEDRMAALRPRLSRVTITVAKNDPSTRVDVRFDGTAISEQAWGVAFYTDVGLHTVTAEAPGMKPFRSELTVDAKGKQYDVNVPALEPEPRATAPVSPPPAPTADNGGAKDKPTTEPPAAPRAEEPPRGRGPLPWILVGTGAALVGVGAVTGVLAFSKHADSDAACPGGRCSADGVRFEDQANTFAWIANVTIPLGVIAGAAGTYLFLRNPTPRASSARASVRVAPTSNGVLLTGAF